MCPACLAAILAAGATSGGGLLALTRIAREDILMKKHSKEVKHKVGTRKEWLAARLKLLDAEKEHTRRGDELTLMRQQLPWVRTDKDYRFETDEGRASLSDLFRGRSQLLIYHLMFGPEYTAACPSCSAIADWFNGFQIHLANHDVMLWGCRVRRSQSCRRTKGAWAGRSRGQPRSVAISTSTIVSGSTRKNSAREASNTIIVARPR